MKYADHLKLKCANCGSDGIYPLELLRSLKAVCKGCGGSFKTQGESINSSILRMELLQRLKELILALEEAFVFDASELEYSTLSTVGDIIDFLQASFPKLSRSDIELKLSLVLGSKNYDGKIVNTPTFLLSELSTTEVL